MFYNVIIYITDSSCYSKFNLNIFILSSTLYSVKTHIIQPDLKICLLLFSAPMLDAPQENAESIGSLLSGKQPSSSDAMDAKRATSTLRDFLLKLDQAREWVCAVTQIPLDITGFKGALPKAEILARVVEAFDPAYVKRIHVSEKKEFRHTDNIMLFLNWCRKMKLRRHFLFETVDLYEEKNIPNVIFCIHGLAMFLNKRGLGKGIVVKSDVVFTYEENSLFAGDLGKISMHKYEDIQNKLDSDSSGDERCNSPETPDATIKLVSKTIGWNWAFKTLKKGDRVSVAALRKFIDFDLSSENARQAIADLQNEIISYFKLNSSKEIERDSILHSIRLLHENLNRLRNVPHPESPTAGDLRLVKQSLYCLVHDYCLCYEIIAAGFELPFRMLFPDNPVGDFHFSKFIAFNLNNRDDQRLLSLARAHFISSRVFKLISEAYASPLSFDMNPISIIKGKGEDGMPLLDDALESKEVRSEIVRRAQLIIDFINTKFDFLLNLELPYYVRLFATHPRFFEYFIEPAIFSSGNNTIAELMSLIHTASALTPQERLYKENDGFVRTTNVGFSDYAPVKEYLEECGRTFPALLVEKQQVVGDMNVYFLEHPVEDPLEVETSMEEINNLIRVLKGAAGLMSGEMLELVTRLEIIHPRDAKQISIISKDVEDIDVGIIVNGDDISKKGCEVKESCSANVNCNEKSGVVYPVNEKNANKSEYNKDEVTIDSKEASLNKGQYSVNNSKVSFKLRLDNQFSSELDEGFGLALNAMLKDLKYRTMLLVSLSDGKTLNDVLKGPITPVSGLDGESLRDSVLSDIRLLRKKGIFSRDDGSELLRMIAGDILTSKYRLLNREIAMNVETSDALFHKGAVLDRHLHCLYSYFSDFTRGMFTKKAGVFFNRETSPSSKYGTYRFPLPNLRGQAYEGLDVKDMELLISCDDPLVIRMTVLLGGVSLCESVDVRFDSLLKLQEEKIGCFDIGGICCLSVGAVVEVINEKYVAY